MQFPATATRAGWRPPPSPAEPRDRGRRLPSPLVDLEALQHDNRANWDDRVPVHVASAGYGVQRFVDDPEHLSDVVAFDAPLLGDVRGRSLVHLQCHIGTDSISLARLGAEVTGLSFSEPAVAPGWCWTGWRSTTAWTGS